jgi:hypothetical protein
MGNNYSQVYGPMPLSWVEPGAIAVLNHPLLYMPAPVTLIVQGKMFSMTDNATIKYLDGGDYARARGRAFSIRDKHTIETLDGFPLLNIKKVSRTCASVDARHVAMHRSVHA